MRGSAAAEETIEQPATEFNQECLVGVVALKAVQGGLKVSSCKIN
jgi:hypothetical protein